MGFGFNIFFAIFFFYILLPLSCILLLLWAVKRKSIFGKVLGGIWFGIFSLIILLVIVRAIVGDPNAKVELEKKDYYGEYVINRTYFPGKQADWQYNTFRFEITSDDTIYFHVTDKNKILKTYKGIISTVKPYNSERLVIHMQQPTHHILSGNPTIYRNNKGFYLVFNSPKFYNVYFTKDKWEPIPN